MRAPLDDQSKPDRTAAGVTTGVYGREWRATITPWGALHPWGAEPGLDWYVAADDRWHLPEREPTLRQHRIEGTAVTETRLRVPNGDVVQRAYSTADRGGLTIVEVVNESTLPVAIAFDRRDVLTERPIPTVPVEGIELPASAFVLPLGHRASIRVGVVHGRQRCGLLPGGLPSAIQVARGWLALTERASRLVLPDGETGAGLAARATAARCELALCGPIDAHAEPAEFLVGLGELVRMGDSPERWLPELVAAVERLGPVRSWAADVGLAAAGRVLAATGERRAQRDLARIESSRPPSDAPVTAPPGVLTIPWLEARLAEGGALLPLGLPPDWLGQPVEAYGIPTSSVSTVAFALRWHGARPAVLWEQTGEPVELTAPRIAPGWSTRERAGEALWPAPASNA